MGEQTILEVKFLQRQQSFVLWGASLLVFLLNIVTRFEESEKPRKAPNDSLFKSLALSQ